MYKSSHQKVVKSNKIYNCKQSFSARICDDLCEVIVSYLSFEDKIRFECVSKQFQRTLYVRHNYLNINYRFISYRRGVRLFALEKVLKRFRFINKIKLNENFCENESVLELIAKYCNHLKCFEFHFIKNYYQTNKTLEMFTSKFGPKLKEIRSNSLETLLVLKPTFDFLNLIKVINYNITNEEDIEIFNIFLTNYKKNIKSLTIKISIDEKDGKLSILLKQISMFENLKNLSLDFYESTLSQEIIENMGLIGKKCKQINCLTIQMIRINTELTINQIFGSNFLQIKRLKLRANYYSGNEFDLNSLKDCKQLIYLEMHFFIINNEFFNNIDHYLPQIQHLKFDSCFGNISDQCFNSLSKLNKLKSISFISFRSELKFDINNGIIAIVDNCPKIESIIIISRLMNKIENFVPLLKSLADKNPGIYFEYQFFVNYGYKRNYFYPLFVTKNLKLYTSYYYRF